MRQATVQGCTLFCADWQDAAAQIPVFDHMIFDPPYESHMHAAKARARDMRTDGVDNPAPLDFDSIEGQRDDLAQLGTRASGWFIAFCTPEGIAPWRDAIEDAGMRYKRCCFWCKPDSAPQFNGQGPAMAVEPYVTAWAGKGHSRWNGGGKRNYKICPCQPRSRDGRHPTEKPIALMADIIEAFTQPGDVILDPCMGSGSTGVAALQTGRGFIGIERDPKYFEIACERLAAAPTASLFSPAPARLIQAEFEAL